MFTSLCLCRQVSALANELRRAYADPDAAEAAAHAALWPRANRRSAVPSLVAGVGAQPVSILRGFFDAFFALETAVWGGFLAGWLPGNEYHASYLARLTFGIQSSLSSHRWLPSSL